MLIGNQQDHTSDSVIAKTPTAISFSSDFAVPKTTRDKFFDDIKYQKENTTWLGRCVFCVKSNGATICLYSNLFVRFSVSRWNWVRHTIKSEELDLNWLDKRTMSRVACATNLSRDRSRRKCNWMIWSKCSSWCSPLALRVKWLTTPSKRSDRADPSQTCSLMYLLEDVSVTLDFLHRFKIVRVLTRILRQRKSYH